MVPYVADDTVLSLLPYSLTAPYMLPAEEKCLLLPSCRI